MIKIRRAEKRDLPRLQGLYEELTEEKQEIFPEKMQQIFGRIQALPGCELLVAEVEGMVTGTLFMLVVPNLTHGARPWVIIENVVVDSRYRRRGIGRALIEYVLARSREAGCYKVQLLSNRKRKEAHEFYRSLGFEDSALGFRYYL